MGGLYPADGGPPSSSPNIWVSACQAGIPVSVAVPASATPTGTERATMASLTKAGVKLHTFPVLTRLPKFKRWGVSFPLVFWVLRHAGDFDIVQAHGAWVFSSLIGLLAARIHGKAFVLVPHESLAESDVLKGNNPFRHGIKKFVKSIYMKYADFFIVASQIEERYSIDAGAAAKSACLYHPLIRDRSSLSPPRHWPACIETLRVGFLGRFDPKKNLDLLIRAVAQMPAVSLRMAGAGPDSYERMLRDLVADGGLGGRAEWLGFIAASQRPAFFSSIDVLAMPSAFECFGMVAAEAMQHGVPVVVSDLTGIAEVVARHYCGLVVAPRVEAIRDALSVLQREPGSLEAYSAQALKACEAELSFAHYGAGLAEIYRALAQRSSM
jgi:glycosyltransferase involved in cell wall biosynthesis